MTDENLSRRSRLAFGIVGTGVLVGGAVLAAVGSQADHSGATYYNASFGRAGQGLDKRSDVKVRGVTVGGIDAVHLGKDGRVSIRIRVDKGVKVANTASAAIEPVSVFGPKDLTLDMGVGEGKGPYLDNGATITRTKDPQELADTAWPTYRLASAIDPQEIATVLHTFSQGLYGQGPALRRTVDNGAKLIDLAYGNRAQIQQLIADIGSLSDTFGGRGDTIVATLRDFNAVSPAINGRPDKVSQLLDQAGGAAGRVGDTLRRHGDDIGDFVDGGGRAVNVLYGERANIPRLVDGLNGFFGLLGNIIRVPGPEKSLLAQVVASLPLDICKILVDVCRASPTEAKSFLKLPGGGR